MTCLIKDNEYNEHWCGSSYYNDSAYEINNTTCATCLNKVIEAGIQAQQRLAIVGYKETNEATKQSG